MNIFDIIMKDMSPSNEGFLGFSNKKVSTEFVPIEINSPIGKLITIDKKSSYSNYLLQTVDEIEFSIFGATFKNKIEIRNVGTPDNPKYDTKEITAIQKALKLLPSKKNSIKKALYEYLLDMEEEYFQDYDYVYTKKSALQSQGSSKTCRSLMVDSACKKFYSNISLEVTTYYGTVITYLSISNDNVLDEGIICTITPKVRADNWEGYVFDDIIDDMN